MRFCDNESRDYEQLSLDSMALEIRLPLEKLNRLRATVEEWRHKRKDLELLVGQLQHAAVVRPGRSFVRHMHELLAATAKDHHHIHHNKNFKADLEWWHTFLLPWNAFPCCHIPDPHKQMYRCGPMPPGLGGVQHSGLVAGSSFPGPNCHNFNHCQLPH